MPDFSEDGKLQWFAIHVRSNFERTVSAVLRNKGLEEFLPTYRCRRRWSDRIKEDDFPLFPGYLFCRLDHHQRKPVVTTNGVVRIVGTGKTPVAVSAQELEFIWRITQSDVVANPWPYLNIGESVVIRSGPLSGLEGILVESKSHRRLVVSVSLLQRSVAVEIDHVHVQPVRGIESAIGRSITTVVLRKGPASAASSPELAPPPKVLGI